MTTDNVVRPGKVRFMYIRSFDKAPVGCIAYRITSRDDKQVVEYGVSFCNPRDRNKNVRGENGFRDRARKIANDRLENVKKKDGVQFSFTVPVNTPLNDIMLRLLVEAKDQVGSPPRPRSVSIKVSPLDDKETVFTRLHEETSRHAVLSGPEALFDMVYNLNHGSGFSRRILDKKVAGVDEQMFYERKTHVNLLDYTS